MLFSMVAIMVVLGIIVLVSNTLRAQTADADTRQTLRLLRASLLQYHETHNTWPSGPTSNALLVLLCDTAAKCAVQSVPIIMAQPRVPIVYDGFGHAVVYLPSRRDSPHPPDFASAGPDGYMGDSASQNDNQRLAATDNIYGIDTEEHLQ